MSLRELATASTESRRLFQLANRRRRREEGKVFIKPLGAFSEVAAARPDPDSIVLFGTLTSWRHDLSRARKGSDLYRGGQALCARYSGRVDAAARRERRGVG